MKKGYKNERFEIIYKQSTELASSAHIIVDKKTGVNYLFYQSGYSGGLTPLLDSQGKPIVTTAYNNYENL